MARTIDEGIRFALKGIEVHQQIGKPAHGYHVIPQGDLYRVSRDDPHGQAVATVTADGTITREG